jgi:hypothetical protein
MEGALELRLPRGRGLQLALAGLALGTPALGVPLALLALHLLGLTGPLADATLAALLLVAAALATAIPPWLLRLRAPRPARLVWDAERITELDGEHPRTALAWRDARARIETTKRGRRAQITDPRGRAITVAEPGAAPRWLLRRAAIAADLGPLLARLVELPGGPPIEPDERDARRPTMTGLVALGTLASGVVLLPVTYVFVLPPLAPPLAALLVCILCAAPALRPFHEVLALLAEGRRLERAEPATVEDGERVELVARRADGTLVRIDLSHARAPDAFLATRHGAELRLVLPPAGWVPAPGRSSLGPPVAPEAVETVHERDVRHELLRGAVVELVLRGLAVVVWGALAFSPLAW